MHGYCFKKFVFYKEKKVPNPSEASTEGLKYIFNAKTIFKHFSRGLLGVGDLLFFIKHGIYRAVSMHFSNNCMHAPYTVRFQKLAAEQYGFISNGGHGQGNTLHLDTLKENLLRLNIYFSTLNVHTVTGVVNSPFLETINRPPRTDRTGNTQILILAEATLRFVLKVFSVLHRWRARYSMPSGCLGRTVVQNLTPDVAITMKHRLRIRLSILENVSHLKFCI